MGRFSKAFRAGLKATGEDLKVQFVGRPGGTRYAAAGRVVRCSHCFEERFVEREAMLNTAGLTLLNLDWLNDSAVVLICVTCTQLTWFGERPEALPEAK